MRRNPAAFAILVGGAIAGAIDIIYAIVFSAAFRGVAPSRILQSVASGVLGGAAFEGGLGAAALGLFLHFVIAFIWATIFYFASRQFPALLQHPVLYGAIYGIVIYGVMNLVVIPLSAAPFTVKFPLPTLITGLLVHMFGIGVPIAWAARKASRQVVG